MLRKKYLLLLGIWALSIRALGMTLNFAKFQAIELPKYQKAMALLRKALKAPENFNTKTQIKYKIMLNNLAIMANLISKIGLAKIDRNLAEPKYFPETVRLLRNHFIARFIKTSGQRVANVRDQIKKKLNEFFNLVYLEQQLLMIYMDNKDLVEKDWPFFTKIQGFDLDLATGHLHYSPDLTEDQVSCVTESLSETNFGFLAILQEVLEEAMNLTEEESWQLKFFEDLSFQGDEKPWVLALESYEEKTDGLLSTQAFRDLDRNWIQLKLKAQSKEGDKIRKIYPIGGSNANLKLEDGNSSKFSTTEKEQKLFANLQEQVELFLASQKPEVRSTIKARLYAALELVNQKWLAQMSSVMIRPFLELSYNLANPNQVITFTSDASYAKISFYLDTNNKLHFKYQNRFVLAKMSDNEEIPYTGAILTNSTVLDLNKDLKQQEIILRGKIWPEYEFYTRKIFK